MSRLSLRLFVPQLFVATLIGLFFDPALFAEVGKEDPSIFSSRAATFAPDIFGEAQQVGGVLRVLTVDERVGYAREKELVRVPVFFHAAEASDDANGFEIVPVEGGPPIPYQADDIRRDASGKIARLHIYFILDALPAWGRRQFNLRAGKNAGAGKAPVAVQVGKESVTLGGSDLAVTFRTDGPLAGAISGLQTSLGKISIPDQNLGPSATLLRQPSPAAKASRSSDFSYRDPQSVIVKSLRWASGPVFAKLVLQLAPTSAPDGLAEYSYIIPKFGQEFIQTQRLYPAGGDTLETVGARNNVLLGGKVILGESAADQQLVWVPAGLRKDLRAVFKYANKALVNTKAQLSLAIVPYSQLGARDVELDNDGQVTFRGSSDFQTRGGSNSDSLRVFWGEVRYIVSKATDVEALWEQQCRRFQPLTAVVDEPWANPEALWNFAKQVNREYGKIKYWGKSFEASLVMDYLSDRDVTSRLQGGSEKTPDIRAVVPSREAVEEAWKKGQGAGALDPYGITYSSSAVALFSAAVQPSRRLDELAYRFGQGSRLVNGQETPEGWPNIRSFANTSNMKMGTYLCSLWSGKQYGDHDLVRWARDAATSQNLLANYGHAQRPYDMTVGRMEPSDVLYISVTDFWLRAAELISNEDLMIHPAVYGRYFDMVDVNSDIYQRSPIREKGSKQPTGFQPSWWRATFLRGQSHDHRWENFGCDPFLGVLGKASDAGKVGITEACYYLQREVGKPQSWNNLMTNVFFPAALTARALKSFSPAARPALPTQVTAAFANGRATVTWKPVAGAVGYRVYRAEQPGGPWKWLNSPYLKTPRYEVPPRAQFAEWQTAAAADDQSLLAAKGPDVKKLKQSERTASWTKMPVPEIPAIADTLVKETNYEDREATNRSLYFVTAEDRDGRESRWFSQEPVPSPSTAAVGK